MLEEMDYDEDEDIKDPAVVIKHQKIKTRLYVVLLAGQYNQSVDHHQYVVSSSLSIHAALRDVDEHGIEDDRCFASYT